MELPRPPFLCRVILFYATKTACETFVVPAYRSHAVGYYIKAEIEWKTGCMGYIFKVKFRLIACLRDGNLFARKDDFHHLENGRAYLVGCRLYRLVVEQGTPSNCQTVEFPFGMVLNKSSHPWITSLRLSFVGSRTQIKIEVTDVSDGGDQQIESSKGIWLTCLYSYTRYQISRQKSFLERHLQWNVLMLWSSRATRLLCRRCGLDGRDAI